MKDLFDLFIWGVGKLGPAYLLMVVLTAMKWG